MKLKRFLQVTALVLATTSLADVKPAKLFTDNMVIQRSVKACIWGWAEPREKVTVTASWGAEASTTASKDGKWMVRLQTPPAGGPFQITFKGNNEITVRNVLSGDVWLCSGQSNMQLAVGSANNANEEAKNANHPYIRHFTVARKASKAPAEDCDGSWMVCAPETVQGFSAVAYFTGRELHKNLNIPIGLINSSWGGTCIEAWTDEDSQKDDPIVQNLLAGFDKRIAKYDAAQAKAKYEKALSVWTENAKRAKASNKKIPRRPRMQADPSNDQNCPSNLYRGMINPLIPYQIKGAIWYQGERNSKSMPSAEHYGVQLDRMICGWRAAWGLSIPFYAVQLPNFQKAQEQPVEARNIWPVTRECFMHVAQNTPDTGIAVTIDIGEANSIHPKNKQDVGKRMASTILNKTYGKQTPTSPLYKSSVVYGNKVVISFEYTGSGLLAKGGNLKTFAIAGSDKKFVWADAKIEKRDGKDVVVVSSDKIPKPVAVRYAWANNPENCNLYSKEGFPASPFRTDSWALEQ